MTDPRTLRYLPSLLDRLTDPDSAGTVAGLGYSLRQMKEAIRRDLEDLFNTAATLTSTEGVGPEVQRSLLAYGLPALTSFVGDPGQISRVVAKQIASLLARFEPRLREVRVVPRDSTKPLDQSLDFIIEAKLTDIRSESFEFNAHFDAKAGRTSVDILEERRRK